MQKLFNRKLYATSIIPIVFIISIILARYFGSHLLFHTIAEIFSVSIGLMMIVVVSYTYQLTKNNFLLYLGLGYFWIGILDLAHMLTYPGMSIYQIDGPNITLTFWIGARFLEAFVLCSAIFVSFNILSKLKVFILFSLTTVIIYMLAFSKYVPILYEEGSGLTALKINLEYTIIFILIITILFYTKKKKNFDESIYYYIIASIVLTILTELTLTLYAKVDDSFTMIAHLFKFLSYWMIFLSIIKISLNDPFKFLAHESSTYNSIPFPSILVDTQGIVRQINDSTESFLNLEKEMILNQNNHMLFHDKNVKEDECKVCKAIKKGKTIHSYNIKSGTSTYSFTVNPVSMENLALGSVQVCIDISQQLKKDIALRVSEEKSRSLIEKMMNAFALHEMIFDKNGEPIDYKFLEVNPGWEKIIGIKSDNVVGKTIREVFPGVKDIWAMQYGRVVKTGIPEEFEQYSAITKKYFYCYAYRPEEGKFAVFFNDITKRKKDELLLIQNESRFRMLFENSEISIWNEDLTQVVKTLEELRKIGVTDIRKHLTQNIKLANEIAMKVKVVDINNATLKLFNADSKEQFLAGINATFGDDAIEVFIDELDAIWNKKEFFSKEAYFKTFDNEIIQGIVTFQIPKEFEQFSNVSVSIIDITNLKKTEKKLKTTNDKLIQKKNEFETILKEAPNPIMLHNEDGKVLILNKVWELTTGYKYQEIDTIDKWTRLAYGKDMPVVKEYIDNVYNLNEKVDEGEYEITTKNGNIVIWQFSSAPLGVIDGKRTVITSAMDITELKYKDKMLINQSRHAAMGEMIGMIAHQWRQPISAISMDANNMLLDIALEDFTISASKEYAQSITQQTQHLSKTIDDFRNFFKPDKEISKVNIEDVLNQTLAIVKDSLKNHNIQLTSSFETKTEVGAYPRELMQVFVNIITNSKDVLVSNKINNAQIYIRVYENKKYINTEICDNGGGIDNDIISKVFDPYFSTKDEKTGTGLGLYMSKMIIQEHLNGIIEVHNNNDGACFAVRLLKIREEV